MDLEILIAASAQDLRFARICLASVRHFHPGIPVRFLPGSPLPECFLEEVTENWNIGFFPLEERVFGWGFVKLEPLFQEGKKRFLVLDADTILLGPVAGIFDTLTADFLVDNEKQPEEEIRQLYYDWEKIAEEQPEIRKPKFVFNTGQWFGTSGLLNREDFSPSIEWTFPRRLREPDVFKNGDQGILNYVINRELRKGNLTVVRRNFMRWPGHGLDDITVDGLSSNPVPQIIHWAGYKAPRLETLPRADLLLHFEKLYYARLPGGERLRETRARRAALAYRYRIGRTKVEQRLRRIFGNR